MALPGSKTPKRNPQGANHLGNETSIDGSDTSKDKNSIQKQNFRKQNLWDSLTWFCFAQIICFVQFLITYHKILTQIIFYN